MKNKQMEKALIMNRHREKALIKNNSRVKALFAKYIYIERKGVPTTLR